MDSYEARDPGSARTQLFDHGQAAVNGDGALAWQRRPSYSYNQITAGYRDGEIPHKTRK